MPRVYTTDQLCHNSHMLLRGIEDTFKLHLKACNKNVSYEGLTDKTLKIQMSFKCVSFVFIEMIYRYVVVFVY